MRSHANARLVQHASLGGEAAKRGSKKKQSRLKIFSSYLISSRASSAAFVLAVRPTAKQAEKKRSKQIQRINATAAIAPQKYFSCECSRFLPFIISADRCHRRHLISSASSECSVLGFASGFSNPGLRGKLKVYLVQRALNFFLRRLDCITQQQHTGVGFLSFVSIRFHRAVMASKAVARWAGIAERSAAGNGFRSMGCLNASRGFATRSTVPSSTTPLHAQQPSPRAVAKKHALSCQQVQLRAQFRRGFADAKKVKKGTWGFLKWTWRLTYLSVLGGLAYTAYGIYVNRNPADQQEPDPNKKTLVVLGKI